MLRLTALRLTNFGPFKGQQSIQFPHEDGVTIIYGENMRGKTSLLNAIRFAFFGRILARGGRDAALHKVGNWEEAKEKKIFGFEVGLDMTMPVRATGSSARSSRGPALPSPGTMATMSRIISWSATGSSLAAIGPRTSWNVSCPSRSPASSCSTASCCRNMRTCSSARATWGAKSAKRSSASSACQC
jgi:hypothetical protein